MRINFSHRFRITRLAVSALLTVCALQAPVPAQETPEQVLLWPSFGLAPGQKVRFTLFVPDGTPAHGHIKIFDKGGIPVAESPSVRIRAGEFRSFDFGLSDIGLLGEETTGRIQLRASCYVRVAVPGMTLEGFAATLEIIEASGGVQDGTSSTVLMAERLRSHDVGDDNYSLGSDVTKDFLIGLAPGQTLRLTVANVGGHTGQAQSPPRVRIGTWIFDSSGRAIMHTEQLEIAHVGFKQFDFHHSTQSLTGEPGTGRLQLRLRLVMSVDEPYYFTADPRGAGLLMPSLELIDSTGQTAARMECANNLKQIGLASH